MRFPATVKVRDVSDIVTKGTTPTTVGRNYTDRGVKFLKVETFTNDGKYIPGKEAHIDRSTHQLLRRSQLAAGDVLFSIAGALGRTTIVRESWLPANTNQAFAIIRPSARRQGINPRYLLWQLRSPAIEKHIAEINVQAAQANLSLEQVRDFQLPILPMAEQHAIVTALDDVSDLIATLERLIAKKQAIKRGMMQQLLTGRARLPGFSKGWANHQAGDVGTFIGGSAFPVRYQGSTSGPIPFFKVSDMNNRGNELFMRHANNCIHEPQRKSMRAVLAPAESIVFAKVGAAVFLERKRILAKSSCIDNNMAAYSVDKSSVDVRFMHYFFSSFQMSSLVATGALPSLNSRQLRSIPIWLPSDLEEQRAIATVLADVDTKLDALRQRLVKAHATRTGMMQQLLTGRTRLPADADA